MTLYAGLLLLFGLVGAPINGDQDRDGLSDFHETYKYFTDPARADSDGDGLPDGDWDERREYAYSVAARVRVLPPITRDILCDDYQDARIIRDGQDYVELEVVTYPLNRVAESIKGNPDWRADTASMSQWTRPGLTSNWDAGMRDDIHVLLKNAGAAVESLDDKALVETASRIVLDHANVDDGFTTFFSEFVEGQVRVHPSVAHAVPQYERQAGRSIAEQWKRELFARSMFDQRVRGTCTSSAIYLNGCMRAIGIPARTILCIPIIDGTDPAERDMLQGLRHHRVRRTIARAVAGMHRGWTSHTFNEAFVGGRWRRLNYHILGQNILDRDFLGLMIHVGTWSDWADAGMAGTWGARSTASRHSDTFGGDNPYSTIQLSDHFGRHARIENPPIPDLKSLTIEQAIWFHDRPSAIGTKIDDASSGHVLVRVKEASPDTVEQYPEFYARAPRQFALRADGTEEVLLSADRGWWVNPAANVRHFYLRISPRQFAAMKAGVSYRLELASSDRDTGWKIEPGVSLTLSAGHAASRPALPSIAARDPAHAPTERRVVIDQLMWTTDQASPLPPQSGVSLALLARVGLGDEFPKIKEFTRVADQVFLLEAKGAPTIELTCGVGGIADSDFSYLLLIVNAQLSAGVEYTVRPRNSTPEHRWEIVGGATVVRK